jgi:hypothetical protein
MPTKRTPVSRPGRRRFSPRAIALFRELQECDEADEPRVERELNAELALRPWEGYWPRPIGSPADERAVRLWKELEEAAARTRMEKTHEHR